MHKISLFLVILLAALVAGGGQIDAIQPTFSVGSFLPFSSPLVASDTEMPTRIAFVGDVMLARHVEFYLDTYGSDYVYRKMPAVPTSTVLVGNFEATIPVNHVQTPDLTFSFSVDAQHVPALWTYGFRYMNLANNHTFDKGQEGFDATKQSLRDAGIQSFGTPDALSSSSVTYVPLDGRVVALIGIDATKRAPGTTELQMLFTEAGKYSDVQIASVHWGVEYAPRHSTFQSSLAHTLVEVGADAVVGHHPHVVQDIELYNGVPIMYSLGNFIFDQYFDDAVQQGLWVDFGFTPEGILEYSFVGITSLGSRSVPRVMTAFEQDVFMKNLAKKSSQILSENIYPTRTNE